MLFKVRAYGSKTAKVIYGKEVILYTHHPQGTAREWCQTVADALNQMVDDALFLRGQFAEVNCPACMDAVRELDAEEK